MFQDPQPAAVALALNHIQYAFAHLDNYWIPPALVPKLIGRTQVRASFRRTVQLVALQRFHLGVRWDQTGICVVYIPGAEERGEIRDGSLSTVTAAMVERCRPKHRMSPRANVV
jgi:hypothetical protein